MFVEKVQKLVKILHYLTYYTT